MVPPTSLCLTPAPQLALPTGPAACSAPRHFLLSGHVCRSVPQELGSTGSSGQSAPAPGCRTWHIPACVRFRPEGEGQPRRGSSVGASRKGKMLLRPFAAHCPTGRQKVLTQLCPTPWSLYDPRDTSASLRCLPPTRGWLCSSCNLSHFGKQSVIAPSSPSFFLTPSSSFSVPAVSLLAPILRKDPLWPPAQPLPQWTLSAQSVC